MQALVKWLHLMALVVWVGEIVFFSFIVAPSVFRVFESPDAGRAVGAIFPTYYRLGYVCGIILLGTCAWFFASGSRGGWGLASILSAAMLAATLYAGVVIQPRATTLRPQIHDALAPQALKDEFGRLHRQAVILNSLVLLCGLGVSIISATKLQP